MLSVKKLPRGCGGDFCSLAFTEHSIRRRAVPKSSRESAAQHPVSCMYTRFRGWDELGQGQRVTAHLLSLLARHLSVVRIFALCSIFLYAGEIGRFLEESLFTDAKGFLFFIAMTGRCNFLFAPLPAPIK